VNTNSHIDVTVELYLSDAWFGSLLGSHYSGRGLFSDFLSFLL